MCALNLDYEVSPLTTASLSSRERHRCWIEKRLQTASAEILYTAYPDEARPLVMKILRDYKDTRYDLQSPEVRRRCQLEALHRNRVFTPEVYKGVARVVFTSPWQDYIEVSDIISDPAEAALNQEMDGEYALVMDRLPEERRLDYLLVEDEAAVEGYLHSLMTYLAEIHEYHSPPLSFDDGVLWGSPQQLHEKLLHNLALLDLILETDAYVGQEERINCLKAQLLDMFAQYRDSGLFDRRVHDGFIRKCHGDVKALNLWMIPDISQSSNEYQVKLLDAIDFTQLYCNIDILSDFAMLAVDIECRVSNPRLVENMIDRYLQLTDQDTTEARAVLQYYQIEKALVTAAITILYSPAPHLGNKYLQVAERCLHHLLLPC